MAFKTPGGSPNMARGTVKWFNDHKGYGFITAEGETEVYVHFSAIEGNGFRTLHEGDKVEFEIRSSTAGNETANVQKR
jgi:CspA family cold shock protein